MCGSSLDVVVDERGTLFERRISLLKEPEISTDTRMLIVHGDIGHHSRNRAQGRIQGAGLGATLPPKGP